jgi:IclR family transcriptional regulator, KDG regulon repressor
LRGYAEQNLDTEDYRLGVKALQLGQAYSNQSNLVARARPVLRALSESTGETVSLVVLQNGQVQFPLSMESKKAVRVSPRIAVSFSAKQNAAGRLLTAHLSDAQLAELLSGNTPQDAAIKNQLNELRNTGQIIDRGAIEADVISLARIVRGSKNEVIAAIEVVIPQYRAKPEVIIPLLEQAATTLSNSLGAGKVALGAAVEKEVVNSPSASTMHGNAQAQQVAASK